MLPILLREKYRHNSHKNHQQELGSYCRPQAIHISREVLLSKDSACVDSSDGSEPNLQRRANRSLGVRPDIVDLICQDSGYIGLCSGQTDEDPQIPDGVVVVISCQRETKYNKERAGDNEGPAETRSIRCPGETKGDSYSRDVWWSREKLDRFGIVSHTLEEVRHEVREGVRRSGRAKVHCSAKESWLVAILVCTNK